MSSEPEIVTRKKRIDKRLKALGWEIIPYKIGTDTSKLSRHAVEEYPTSTGPSDYALFINGKLLGILEAKRLSVGTQNVIEQAKRYAKGLVHSIGNWNGLMVPFLYATNGEQVYHYDARQTKNLTREIADYHSPEAMWELFNRINEDGYDWLQKNKINNEWIRPYQKEAIYAVEESIINSNRKMMVAMATGTGKTFTTINLIYRLLKSKTAKRILFLVDRRSLAAQSVRAFSSFDTPDKNKFHKEYELYSQSFRKEEFEDDPFDPQILPNSYLTKPDATKTFVYVATIQRMAINLFGKEAILEGELGAEEEDAEPLDIPIHAFDVIIADECHRGYTSKETNVWRSVLNHFDAIKIGLTATPAAHTIAFFGEPIYKYGVDKAIEEGYLVDHDAIKIKSDVLINGAFLKEGEQIGIIDTTTGRETIDQLEDERAFSTTEIEHKITTPDTNRKIIKELAKYAYAFEQERGHFPKTLIFAVNDIDHTSHADTIVKICKEVFNRGDDFVAKITGSKSVDRPLQKIKEFRNRPEPKVVVTVDMLSTGVDIPALEFIVFLRPVKSRILWEQMLGRGTRLCPEINKDKFVIFDCFNGTLIQYFKDASNFKVEPPSSSPVSIKEIINKIYNNVDREYNVKRLVKRLRRIEKTMSAKARSDFEKFIAEGDIGKFAEELPSKIANDFMSTLKLLRDEKFIWLLENYERAKQDFLVGYEVQDEVTSELVFEAGKKYNLKAQDYLEEFSNFLKEKKNDIEALKILLERPKNWSTQALKELREVLMKNDFPEENLRKAHRIVYHKALTDIISMVKHAVKKEEPLLDVHERVDFAVQQVFKKRILNDEQALWVNYIKEHLIQNLTLDADDFEYVPVFEQHGGFSKFKKLFKYDYQELISEINAAIAA